MDNELRLISVTTNSDTRKPLIINTSSIYMAIVKYFKYHLNHNGFNLHDYKKRHAHVDFIEYREDKTNLLTGLLIKNNKTGFEIMFKDIDKKPLNGIDRTKPCGSILKDYAKKHNITG